MEYVEGKVRGISQFSMPTNLNETIVELNSINDL